MEKNETNKLINRLWSKLVRLSFVSLSFFIGLFLHRSRKRVLLSGSCGESCDDSPYYLAKSFHESHPEITLFWVGKPSIKEEVSLKLPFVHFLKFRSFSSLIVSQTCKFIFYNQSPQIDLGMNFILFRNVYLIYLLHGTGGLKKSYSLINEKVVRQKNKDPYAFDSFPWTLSRVKKVVTISNELERVIIPICFQWTHVFCYLKSGMPRNDILSNDGVSLYKNDKDRLCKRLDLCTDKNIVLYMPTWRKGFGFDNPLFTVNSLKRLDEIMGKTNSVFVFQNHFSPFNEMELNTVNFENIKYVDKKTFDTQELLVASDVLISDYSSVIFDYLLLNKAIILFPYDLQLYEKKPGLIYKYEHYNYGPVAMDTNELFRLLSLPIEQNHFRENIEEGNKEFNTYNGCASMTIIKWMIGAK
jgi:CDP-glycerol glycerophosphotransferase